MFRDCVRTEQLRYMKKTERERIMYNYKIVEQVSRKKKSMSGILRKVMVIFAVFSRKDYEYTLENDVLTIDVIYGKKYRKTAHILELRNMEVTAPHWHESVARYKKNGGTEKIKKYDYTSYDDDVPYYTMIVTEDGNKIKLLLDLTEEMLHIIKTQHPQKVYFA